MPAGRVVLAIVAGVVAAGILVFAAEAVGHSILAGDAVFAAVAIGYGLGAAGGTATAVRIAGPGMSAIIPVLLALLAVANLFVLAHPPWFVPLAAVLLIAGWWAGTSIGGPRRRTRP